MILLTSIKRHAQKLPIMKTTCGFTLFFLALCAPQVKGATIYTYVYTGNHYTGAVSPYTTSMDITGSFTFASALPSNTSYPTTETPITWSISDGVETITDTSGPLLAFNVGTNLSGNIINWSFGTSFNISTGQLFIASANAPGSGSSSLCGTDACDDIFGLGAGHFVGLASVASNPGTWTLALTSTTTPEPSSVILISAGLFAIAYIARKRVSSASTSNH